MAFAVDEWSALDSLWPDAGPLMGEGYGLV
jgi:hypothetical protein